MMAMKGFRRRRNRTAVRRKVSKEKQDRGKEEGERQEQG
jgi:hypothetical protein